MSEKKSETNVEDNSEVKTIVICRTHPKRIHRMTNAERDKLLRILFDYEFAEKIGNEKLKYKDIQKEIEAKHGLSYTIHNIQNLVNKWGCEYDDNKNIKRLYRV